MKVCCTGDFHGCEPPPIPDCDLLLIAGDFGVKEAFGSFKSEESYLLWLLAWLQELHSRGITTVAIAGNHEFDTQAIENLPLYYLEDSELRFGLFGADETDETRIKVWGSPWSPTFGKWAFMRPDEDLAKVWEKIPADVDIILIHGPPYGFGDLAQRRVNAGSQSLLEHLARGLREGTFERLKLIACGHIHEGYGRYNMAVPYGADREIIVVNGSWVDASYRPGNPPIMVEL